MRTGGEDEGSEENSEASSVVLHRARLGLDRWWSSTGTKTREEFLERRFSQVLATRPKIRGGAQGVSDDSVRAIV